VGIQAAKMALGLGAEITIFDINPHCLEYLDDIFGGRVTTLMSNYTNIAETVEKAHMVIGAVLVPGAKAPRLVTLEMVKKMISGAVIVDVAVDQGGCVEETKPTTYEHPTYTIHGVTFYCVANIPGAVARTSTFALTNATFPYVYKLANLGAPNAFKEDLALARGANLYHGEVSHQEVAISLNLKYTPLNKLISN